MQITIFAPNVWKLIGLRIHSYVVVVVMGRGMPVVARSLHLNYWILAIIGCALCVLLMGLPVQLPTVLGLPLSWIRTGLFGYCIFAMLEVQL